MSGGHYLDLAAWARHEHFELFRRMAQPFFAVMDGLDVHRFIASFQQQIEAPAS